MQRYTITKEGRLVDLLGNDIEPDGYIIFYGRDESDMDRRDSWREYRARFSEGILDEIVRVETDEHDRTWYGLASFRWFEAPTYLFGDPDEDDSDDPAG